MKLVSTLRNRNNGKETKCVMSADCSIGQALTMIESWCYDNGADYPSISSIVHNHDHIRVIIYTRDKNYVNFFEIKKD